MWLYWWAGRQFFNYRYNKASQVACANWTNIDNIWRRWHHNNFVWISIFPVGTFDTCNPEETYNLDARVVDSLHNQFIISNNCKLPFFGGNIYNLTKFCQENDLSNLGEGDFHYSFIWLTTAKKQPPKFPNNFVPLVFHYAYKNPAPDSFLVLYWQGGSSRYKEVCNNSESFQEYCTQAHLYNITQGDNAAKNTFFLLSSPFYVTYTMYVKFQLRQALCSFHSV